MSLIEEGPTHHKVIVDGSIYDVTVEQKPEGEYIASVVDYPGCFSKGYTLEGTLGEVRDAIVAWKQDNE